MQSEKGVGGGDTWKRGGRGRVEALGEGTRGSVEGVQAEEKVRRPEKGPCGWSRAPKWNGDKKTKYIGAKSHKSPFVSCQGA